jgi:hypothetical protein
MSALEIEFSSIGETTVIKREDGSIEEITRREENGSYMTTVTKRFTDKDGKKILHIRSEMQNPKDKREVQSEATYKNGEVVYSSLSEEIPYGKRGNRIKYTTETKDEETSKTYVIYDKYGKVIKEGAFGYDQDFNRVLDR